MYKHNKYTMILILIQDKPSDFLQNYEFHIYNMDNKRYALLGGT